jgi:hypothetical protein
VQFETTASEGRTKPLPGTTAAEERIEGSAPSAQDSIAAPRTPCSLDDTLQLRALDPQTTAARNPTNVPPTRAFERKDRFMNRSTPETVPRRVPADEVARTLDEIIELTGLQRPYKLYRYLADQTGVHPTTVLRYHHGRLGTANGALHRCAEDLLIRARRGEVQGLGDGGGGTRPHARTSRVPVEQVQERIRSIQRALGLEEHQFLYRHLAEEVGMHTTTVLRYHRGDLRTAPVELLDALERLEDRISRGEVVSFARSANGANMVVRERTIEILERLIEVCGVEHKAGLFRRLDEQLGLRQGTIARIYYDRKLRFVRAEIHDGLERWGRHTEYDPCRIYTLGERVNHHMFGTGTVTGKVHKNKVQIRFAGERTMLLAEAVPEDPFLHLRSGGWGAQREARLGTRGLAS